MLEQDASAPCQNQTAALLSKMDSCGNTSSHQWDYPGFSCSSQSILNILQCSADGIYPAPSLYSQMAARTEKMDISCHSNLIHLGKIPRVMRVSDIFPRSKNETRIRCLCHRHRAAAERWHHVCTIRLWLWVVMICKESLFLVNGWSVLYPKIYPALFKDRTVLAGGQLKTSPAYQLPDHCTWSKVCRIIKLQYPDQDRNYLKLPFSVLVVMQRQRVWIQRGEIFA